jgi:hypothetical protein
VDYPKNSDPDDESYDRVRRPDRHMLPFVALEPGQPLTLRQGSAFRELLDSGGDDLGAVLSDLSDAVDDATDGLSATAVVSAVLEQVFDPVRGTLGVDAETAVDELVSFRAEGGSVAGLLRALQPALRLGSSSEALPLRRHGSTTAAVLAVAETLAAGQQHDAVVVCDDFSQAAFIHHEMTSQDRSRRELPGQHSAVALDRSTAPYLESGARLLATIGALPDPLG